MTTSDGSMEIKAAEAMGELTLEEEKLAFEREKEVTRAKEKQQELAIKEKEVQLKKQQNVTKANSKTSK